MPRSGVLEDGGKKKNAPISFVSPGDPDSQESTIRGTRGRLLLFRAANMKGRKRR
jgi:hypothetical protein